MRIDVGGSGSEEDDEDDDESSSGDEAACGKAGRPRAGSNGGGDDDEVGTVHHLPDGLELHGLHALRAPVRVRRVRGGSLDRCPICRARSECIHVYRN